MKTDLRYVVVLMLSSQPRLRHSLTQTQLSLILEVSEANTDSSLIHPKQEIFCKCLFRAQLGLNMFDPSSTQFDVELNLSFQKLTQIHAQFILNTAIVLLFSFHEVNLRVMFEFSESRTNLS